jgi:hypothetical protein
LRLAEASGTFFCPGRQYLSRPQRSPRDDVFAAQNVIKDPPFTKLDLI